MDLNALSQQESIYTMNFSQSSTLDKVLKNFQNQELEKEKKLEHYKLDKPSGKDEMDHNKSANGTSLLTACQMIMTQGAAK